MKTINAVASYITAALCSLSIAACACNGTRESTSPHVSAENATADMFTAKGCMRTGCSGHLCAEEGEQRVSTCQWKEEYACYKTARCEKQSDGNCGWTQSEALTSCLKSAAEQPAGKLNFAPK